MLITDSGLNVKDVLSETDLRHVIAGSLNDWLSEDPVDHYAYGKSFEQASQDPFIVVHTSGSTGLPKPIVIYHGSLATVDKQHLISPSNGYKLQLELFSEWPRSFCALPPFHVSLD